MNGASKHVRFSILESLEGKLCTAIQLNQYDRVKQLLQCGASPNETCGELSAVHWAAGQGDSSMTVEMMKLLLRSGGDPNLLLGAGSSPVHIAASWGYVNMLKLLVEHSGDPWIKDVDGFNAWDLALNKHQWEVLKYLASYMEKDAENQGDVNVSTTLIGSRELSLLDDSFINSEISSCNSTCNGSFLMSGNIFDATSTSFMNEAAYLNSCVLTESSLPSVQVLEYSYVDKDFGVSLTERRFPPVESLLNQATCSDDTITSIDSERLVQELRSRGFQPGPITETTKRVYTLKLKNLESSPGFGNGNSGAKYPSELVDLLENSVAFTKQDHETVRLERAFNENFKRPLVEGPRNDALRKSFNYLLLDPRLTQDILLSSQAQLNSRDLFGKFISAVFYIGKGKQTRPYEHLYEARKSHSQQNSATKASEKLNRILDIWDCGHGVVSLHIFQNSLPAEAHSREAAMIDALGLSNLCNIKSGSYYGVCTSWTAAEKRRWGVHLLAKAFRIYLHEGERQLYPSNL